MAMKNALVMSSRLSQLQKIDGVSMKGHSTPQPNGERKSGRRPSAAVVFFNNLKSICIVFSPLFDLFRIAFWRKICFNMNRPITHSVSIQKTSIFRPQGDFNDSGRGDYNAW